MFSICQFPKSGKAIVFTSKLLGLIKLNLPIQPPFFLLICYVHRQVPLGFSFFP